MSLFLEGENFGRWRGVEFFNEKFVYLVCGGLWRVREGYLSVLCRASWGRSVLFGPPLPHSSLIIIEAGHVRDLPAVPGRVRGCPRAASRRRARRSRRSGRSTVMTPAGKWARLFLTAGPITGRFGGQDLVRETPW